MQIISKYIYWLTVTGLFLLLSSLSLFHAFMPDGYFGSVACCFLSHPPDYLVYTVTVIYIFSLFLILTKTRGVIAKAIGLPMIILLYSSLTVVIHADLYYGHEKDGGSGKLRAVYYPGFSKSMLLDFDDDQEHSTCEVSTFFYKIKNKYDEGVFFRGLFPVSISDICNANFQNSKYR